jgi:hypothetical protein
MEAVGSTGGSPAERAGGISNVGAGARITAAGILIEVTCEVGTEVLFADESQVDYRVVRTLAPAP